MGILNITPDSFSGDGLLSAPAPEVEIEEGQLVRRTQRVCDLGIGQVAEGRQIFPTLSVTENLEMGAYTRKTKEGFDDDLEHVFSLFPRLKERADQHAGTLSGGEQQMLMIGRALMARPKLLLLDEPSMGLAPMLVAKIFDIVREISRQGVTILLVEQNARRALEAANRGYVMESGSITLAGESAQLLGDPKVREAYLGEAA